MIKIINLISSPRNISTALMYSFAQRSDTKVIDEPFYSYYLTKSKTEHPGQKEIINSMETDPIKIVQSLQNDKVKPILFLKNMAHHLIEMDLAFLRGFINLFLIRDPKKLISSFAKVIPNPKEKDVGVKKQYELFEMLLPEGPIVMDSGELLKNPEAVLTQLCLKIKIPFDKNMLRWPAGPIREDGIWAKYWYKNVHASTGFYKPKNNNASLPENCRDLYQKSLYYYNQLNNHSIKAKNVTKIQS